MSYDHPAGEDFKGKLGSTVYESEPWWPDEPIPKGSPNVVLVVLDDTGFSHFGCYGSTIDTPNIDRLAAQGLRFTSFHTTAVCSATRACLLTGRNHHSVGMAKISNMDTGYPNMRGALPRSSATLAEILRDKGYATFATGKWHLAPLSECTSAGPFRNWPLQKGFDRFYGFLQGETDQFYPELTYDNHFVDPPATPEEGYHVSEDIVDHAIGFIRDSVSLVPERPFFLYLPFGATHSPHQAPERYLKKYRGQFDAGWDAIREQWFARQRELGIVPPETHLAPRNPGVRPWNELSDNERRFAARLQEAFAGMLDHTDQQIGRLVDFLSEMDLMDDTLFIVMSDNGASQEGGASGVLDEFRWFNGMKEDVDEAVARLDDIGGPRSHSNIPWGWAQAGNTPLKWYKQNTHGGGVRDPLVVHWPRGLKGKGEIRPQFCHAIDLAPTVLDLLGLDFPKSINGVEQMPVHGKSLVPILSNSNASVSRDTQYFEMFGHRGIWNDGWKAVTHHNHGTAFEDDQWELYNLDEDFSEFQDLSQVEPEKLKELVDLWWAEAENNGVLPLDDRLGPDLFRAARRTGLPSSRRRFAYYPPISPIVADACPPLIRGGKITVDFEHPHESAEGALIARGDINSGFGLYLTKGKVHFHYNAFGERTFLTSNASLSAGWKHLELHIERDESRGGSVMLFVDGQAKGKAYIPRLIRMLSSRGMDIGRSIAPINDDYKAPFVYPGEITCVVFDIPTKRRTDDKHDLETINRVAMGRQ